MATNATVVVIQTHPKFCPVCREHPVVEVLLADNQSQLGCPHCEAGIPIVHLPWRDDQRDLKK